MTLWEEYKKRDKDCTVCKHRKTTKCNHECYGAYFEDELDFVKFATIRVMEKAREAFEQTKEGRNLKEDMTQAKNDYDKAYTAYHAKRDEYAQDAKLKFMEQLSNIGK